MKRLITSDFQTRILIKFVISSFLMFSQLIVFGQTWDGGGDGTSWNDPLNWDTDNVPAANAVVTIGGTVTITGSVPNNPIRISIPGSASVTLDMDLTIGNGTNVDHCLVINSNATLNLGVNGNSRSFTLNGPSTRGAFTMLAGASNPIVNISPTTTVSIIQAQNGVNIVSSTATMTNDGTLNISGVATDGILISTGSSFINNGSISANNCPSDGIDNSGIFTNNGTISITNPSSYGINNKTGSIFDNTSSITITGNNTVPTDGIWNESSFTNSGTLTISNASDDCLEIAAGTFSNEGIVDVTAKPTAGSTNAALVIDPGASFINEDGAILNANGGGSANCRPIIVGGALSVLDNYGTLTTNNGNPSIGIRNDGGTITNFSCAVINIIGARISNSTGILNNFGYIEQGSTSNNLFNPIAATANNYGFYKFGTSFAWNAAGSTANDYGVNVNLSPFGPTLPGECTHDLSSVGTNNMNIYSWKYGSTSLGNNDAAGVLTLPGGNIFPGSGAGPYTITQTQCPNYSSLFNIQIKDVCATTLPIKIFSFDANQVGKNVVLDWSLQQNEKSNYFVVESSADNSNFKSLGKVDSHNIGVAVQKYSFVDPSPFEGANYYRIKQVDSDGLYSYSEVVYVRFTPASSNGFSLVPNLLKPGQPVRIDTGSFTGENDYLMIGIFDANGHLVQKQEIKNLEIDILNTSELTAGLYLVKALNRSDLPVARFLIMH